MTASFSITLAVTSQHFAGAYPPNWDRVVRREQLISGTHEARARDE